MSKIALTLDNDTLALLDESAKFRSLSREDMLRQAIQDAADYDRYYRESVGTALLDVEAGRTISNDQMQAEMAVLFKEIATTNQIV